MAQQTWDREVDVLVVGSAAAALAAAMTEKEEGADVLITDRRHQKRYLNTTVPGLGHRAPTAR